jgi:hypothetical protein
MRSQYTLADGSGSGSGSRSGERHEAARDRQHLRFALRPRRSRALLAAAYPRGPHLADRVRLPPPREHRAAVAAIAELVVDAPVFVHSTWSVARWV